MESFRRENRCELLSTVPTTWQFLNSNCLLALSCCVCPLMNAPVPTVATSSLLCVLKLCFSDFQFLQDLPFLQVPESNIGYLKNYSFSFSFSTTVTPYSCLENQILGKYLVICAGFYILDGHFLVWTCKMW